MRRIQSNLSYLAAVADRMYKPPEKVPSQPAVMDTLPKIAGNTIPVAQLETLRTMYMELKELFPSAASKAQAPPGVGQGAPVNGGQPHMSAGPMGPQPFMAHQSGAR